MARCQSEGSTESTSDMFLKSHAKVVLFIVSTLALCEVDIDIKTTTEKILFLFISASLLTGFKGEIEHDYFPVSIQNRLLPSSKL